MSNSKSAIFTSLHGIEVRGVVHHDKCGDRLEYTGEPGVSVLIDDECEPAACLRDLVRVSRAMEEHHELLTQISSEDCRALDNVRAERDRIYAEVHRFVPPSSGWVHGLARHHAMKKVAHVLDWRVEAECAKMRRRMACRLAEIAATLEVLDISRLATLELVPAGPKTAGASPDERGWR